MTTEKIEITKEHLNTIRNKWDCDGMSNEEIIRAMLRYEKRTTENGSVWVLEAICFPSFQSYLDQVRASKHF